MFRLKQELNNFRILGRDKPFLDSCPVDSLMYKCCFEFALNQSNSTKLVKLEIYYSNMFQAMPLSTIGTAIAFVGRDGKIKVSYSNFTLAQYVSIAKCWTILVFQEKLEFCI